MKRLALIMALLTAPAQVQAQQRVVSLDYCADQYVLALAQRRDVLAVSPAAASEYSYLAARAAGLPRLRPTGEQILLAQPDLVVRQWGGGYDAPAYLARFGIPVIEIQDGRDFRVAKRNLEIVGQAVGAGREAARLIADMDQRLARIRAGLLPRAQRPRALYLTTGGATTGKDTFVHEMMEAAGVINMAAENGAAGWREIDLEAIALDPPDMIIAAFFDLKADHVYFWSVGRHSFLRRLMARVPTVRLPSAQVACAGWFSVDAIEAIHAASRVLARPVMAARQ